MGKKERERREKGREREGDHHIIEFFSILGQLVGSYFA